MDDYESIFTVLRTILGSCLSDINKLMPLWYYGILLPEVEEDCSLWFLLNLIIVKLKQILESCELISINNNIVKFVINISGYGGNYSWSMFLLKNSLSKNYFSKMSLVRYKNMYFISLGVHRDTKIDPLTQFQFKKKRKYAELNRLLIQKVYKMKYILQINTLLMNSNVEEWDFSNNISSSTNVLLPPNIDSNLAVNFIKNIIFNNNIKGDSTSKRIIESVIFFKWRKRR